MNNHEAYMQHAINIANETKNKGGVAIGAVLVNKEGEVIATGGSEVALAKDPTAHAEINCIRLAAKLLNSDDLYPLTLYCTLEPCHMCLSACAWARIPNVFFGAYRKDVSETLFDIKGDFSDETEGGRMNLREKISMKVMGGILEDQCASLLKNYEDSPRHN